MPLGDLFKPGANSADQPPGSFWGDWSKAQLVTPEEKQLFLERLSTVLNAVVPQSVQQEYQAMKQDPAAYLQSKVSQTPTSNAELINNLAAAMPIAFHGTPHEWAPRSEEEILKGLKVNIVKNIEEGDFAGLFKTGESSIRVKERANKFLQEFTQKHETGHWLYEHLQGLTIADMMEKNPQLWKEAQATSAVKSHWKGEKTPFGVDWVEAMADLYAEWKVKPERVGQQLSQFLTTEMRDRIRPDITKVGTGQGAQSYGHGLYFAENPEVANTYRNSVARYRITIKDSTGQAMGESKVVDEAAANQVKKLYGDKAIVERISGTTYQVNIPDEHVAKMLDWDKPLSEQSKFVKDALRKHEQTGIAKRLEDLSAKRETAARQGADVSGFNKHIQILKEELANPNLDLGGTGARHYEWLSNTLGSRQAATETLNKLGIPGIKYLDQGSRATKPWRLIFPDGAVSYLNDAEAALAKDTPGILAGGKLEKVPQTRNFVVFDTNIIKDVKKK